MRIVRSLLLVVAACTAASCSGTAPAGAAVAGPIVLAVDATDVTRKVFHVSEKLHVTPGSLTLVYPKWIPGEHGPTGPITDLVGLKMSAGGKPVDWRRDDVDMYAFHVSVPAGADRLDVSFDFLSALGTAGFSSAASVTPHLAIVTWNQLLLYPEGVATDNVQVEASLRLPRGWQYATALKHADTTDGEDSFAAVSLTTLVDSPVLAGEHFLKLPLDTSAHGVELDVAADSDAALKMSPEFGDQMKRLVAEADALFGARHFNDYHFLFTLSDQVAHFGLEHHQSNDTRQAELAMVTHNPSLWVLAHEFTHSWNGKYRRPAGLATPDFQAPMKGELLWVYEGLTQYIGMLLAARSGLISEDYYHEHLAASAAYLDHQPGRAWRPLVDTTVTAQLLYAAPKEWSSYRRGVDFYDEGWLIWLDADTKIRELTHGQKSLDDFCKLFHGGESGAPALKTYALDDVVTTMNAVAANDWKTFFQDRVTKTSPHAPLEGMIRAGWQLAYNNARNKAHEFLETGENKRTDASYSLGLLVGEGGKIADVMVGSPAYAAGLGPGMKLVRVNGKAYSPDGLRQAILADALSKSPMTVEVDMDGGKIPRTLSINYHDGLQEPHLERAGTTADVLHEIIKPHSGGGK
jgi:predicted metalloprotease with PDZ domain